MCHLFEPLWADANICAHLFKISLGNADIFVSTYLKSRWADANKYAHLFEPLWADADKNAHFFEPLWADADIYAHLFEPLWADADVRADEVLAEELAPVRLRLALVHV